MITEQMVDEAAEALRANIAKMSIWGAARAVLEAAEPLMMATQHATEKQLRESNTARQERIWALEATLASMRKIGPGLPSPWQLWEMYARENKERCRLLERNRKLTAKLLHRARVIGGLRDANRRMLIQAVGAGNKVPD